VGHLETSSSEATLDVEALVGLAAVENALVAPDLLGNKVQGLDESKAQLLALLVLGDCDILDVTDGAEVVDAMGEDGSAAMHILWVNGRQHQLTTCAQQSRHQLRQQGARSWWCPQ
jgi:hypothetical protein